MIPSFFYPQDPFIITAQVDETIPLPANEELAIPETLNVDQAIHFAGENQQLIRISYEKTYGPESGTVKDYTVEPYSYRVRGGKTAFFGYDVNTDNIKGFYQDSIRHVQVLPEKFNPRWVIEV